ncbi:hypothetical protein [Confluentibacter citreus]|uniref:hypothetical protein n=1 Tax=Confluentibacter citreus TaxID=2007307 RepID=UPI000C289F83|nr:hypothetical protein [Confluentibacter citreus]
MDKIVTGLIVGIIILILNILVRKYIDPIMPDKKKAVSYMKKFLLFNMKYTLTIFLLIYFFISLEFNKLFVLIISLYLSIIFFNIIIDFTSKISELNAQIRQLHLEMIEKIAKEVDKINGIKN